MINIFKPPSDAGFQSINGGLFSTVVRGPVWNSEAADPEYKVIYYT